MDTRTGSMAVLDPLLRTVEFRKNGIMKIIVPGSSKEGQKNLAKIQFRAIWVRRKRIR